MIKYLDGFRLGDLGEDAVQAAVIADGQVAEVMVGVADDGHGGIWKTGGSRLSRSEQVTKTSQISELSRSTVDKVQRSNNSRLFKYFLSGGKQVPHFKAKTDRK